MFPHKNSTIWCDLLYWSTTLGSQRVSSLAPLEVVKGCSGVARNFDELVVIGQRIFRSFQAYDSRAGAGLVSVPARRFYLSKLAEYVQLGCNSGW